MGILFLGAGRLETGVPRETTSGLGQCIAKASDCQTEVLPAAQRLTSGCASGHGRVPLLLSDGQRDPCRRGLSLRHSANDNEARRSGQDATAIHAGIGSVFIHSFPISGAKIVEKTYR